jgi:phosphoglycolate phosphatase
MKYDTVLFDLDGTILNSLEDLADSVNSVLESSGYPLRSLEEIKSFTGAGYRVLLTKALPKDTSAAEIERCTILYRKIYLTKIADKSCPYDGIIELLKKLKSMGCKLGVVSNKFETAAREACRVYFEDYFDYVIGDDPIRSKKPSPEGVWEALKALGSSREKAVYLGDSDVDIKTAKNAGLVSVGVSWGFRSRAVLEESGADFIIDSPGELLNILE